jgi:hypothetical protein
MPNIKMPDGAVVAFPDDMPPDQIKQLILARFPDAGKDMFPQDYMSNAPGQMAQGQADADPRLSMPQPTAGESVNAFTSSAINGVPIAGPWLYDQLSKAKAAVHGQTPEQIRVNDQRSQERAPVMAGAGSVTGSVGPFAAAGLWGPTSRILGFTGADLGPAASLGAKAGDFAARTALGGASTYGITTADQVARGVPLPEAMQNSVMPAGFAAAVPAAGVVAKGLGVGANFMFGGLPGKLANLTNPRASAARMVGNAFARDKKGLLDPALDNFATQNGLPITNLDRGGSVTRSLARNAANVSPDAKATIDAAMDRGVPSMRASNFVTQLVGGSADDIALRQGIRDTARLANEPAYRAAYSSPNAQSIWSNDLAGMFQSDEFLKAVKGAESIGRTRAAGSGGTAVKSPFEFHADGSVTMKPGVTPTLEFWDKVKIGLDRQIEALSPTERSAISDLTLLKQRLTGVLDSAVPEYKTARAGASMFFGAEDALDAGRNFALKPMQLQEAKAAYSKFTDAEKKAFGIGWASSITDKLKSGADSYAIIKQVFESPANREMAALALGSDYKVQQLKAYTTVEAIMEQSKRAVQGNSTTAQQLLYAGANVGAGGYGWMTGDWKPVMLTAGLTGSRLLGRVADQKVMNEVATLLTSSDKAALNKLVTNAAMSPQWSLALQAILKGTAVGTAASMTQGPLAAQ